MVFTDLIHRLKNLEQRKYLDATLAFVVHLYFPSQIINKENEAIMESKIISGVASLLCDIAENTDVIKDHLVSSLTRSIIPSLEDSLAARRSVIAALAKDEGSFISLFV